MKLPLQRAKDLPRADPDASQAQQTTVEEPELPETWVKGLPEGTTHYSAGTPFNECGSGFDVVVRAFKYGEEGDLLVYRTDNDGEYGGWAKPESLFKTVPEIYQLHALTATQMHDHYQAGVRAGMEQSQDAKRYRAIRKALNSEDYVLIHRLQDAISEDDDPDENNRIDAAIDAAMKGDNHE